MSRPSWTWWDWRAEPTAPATWTAGRRVAIVDGLHADGATPVALPAAASIRRAVEEQGTVAVFIESPKVTAFSALLCNPWPARMLPALRVETQANLSADALRAIHCVNAAHRALVISPREEIDMDPPTCPTCGGHDAVTGSDGATPFCREHGEEMGFSAILDPCAESNGTGVDLVIVQGPTGPDAWPMHPAWLRKLRDKCDEAGGGVRVHGLGRLHPRGRVPRTDRRLHEAQAGLAGRWRRGDSAGAHRR